MAELLRRIRELRPKGRRTTIIAIDGHGGAGKSTLARALASRVPGTTAVSTDDFSRPNVPGWEWKRMKVQVLDPLNRDEAAKYQRYDWESDKLAEWRRVPVGGAVIIEGVSAMRTELGVYWDLAIWVMCSRERRLERGVARDGEGKRPQWENVWMPAEDKYVETQRPDRRADLIVSGEEPFRL